MRFWHDNFIDAAATVISSNTEETTLPDDNVAHEHKTKVYRTGTTTTTEWIKFDLGSAKAVDGFALLNHTLDSNETAVNIEGNATDSWGSPSFTEVVDVDGNDPAFNKFSSAETYQWWRFEFTKAASGTARDLGRIFLGDIYDTTEDPDSTGYSDETDENSILQKSIDGQTFSYIKSEYLSIQTMFKAVSLAQAIQFKTIFDALGTHTPLFIQVDPAASDGIRELMHYVKFTSALKRKVYGFDSELKWDISLSFEQQL